MPAEAEEPEREEPERSTRDFLGRGCRPILLQQPSHLLRRRKPSHHPAAYGTSCCQRAETAPPTNRPSSGRTCGGLSLCLCTLRAPIADLKGHLLEVSTLRHPSPTHSGH